MSKTRQQIQFKAFAILTGGDVGANVSAEDATELDGYINVVVDYLSAKKIISIPDANDLDDALFEPFSQMVANFAANSFAGKTDPAVTRYYENEFRVLNAQTPGFSPQIVEYF